MRTKPHVNENIQLHMTATYIRNGRLKNNLQPNKPKRTFSLVIKGFMLSSVLLSSLAVGGVSALAATSPDLPTHPIIAASSQLTKVHEDALVENLRLAVKAIEDQGWTREKLQSIKACLTNIEEKLNEEASYGSASGLMDALLETEIVITKYAGDGLFEGRYDSIYDTLQRIKTMLNNVSSPPVSKKGEVKIASVSKDEVTVVIDGQVQAFPQPAVTINGSTMVPMRAIFEKLGAEIKWNGETRTVTATKGNTVIILTLDRDIAIINGNPVKLTAKAQSINGNTMVPLRFVSEALGAAVKWDGATRTAYIESTGTTDDSQVQVVNGIKVKYGKHTYSVSNQSEYDQSLKIVEDALKGFDDIVFGGRYNEYFELFLKGERWSGDRSDRSERNIGLKIAEGSIGDLVNAGVSRETIIKADKAAAIALSLFSGKYNPLDGSPRSIYDVLVLNRNDCDPTAQVYSAVFDSLGFNTAIIGGSNHAEVLIQIDGKWFECGSGTFRLIDVSKALKNGSYIISLPTDGTILM
ncbi:copper amine oxidase N-terminal domain-containing protein [Cohnella massiliensis]|uniref:copper amine oxidase N-terminal domain-containing protein n=1 Tax=Cohnella massiliensis TaxID=1816691 RepID=UPI0009B9A94F|nr:copper amine oxidase N-terminal domain-containing protein [Cohnella massiliensis]